LLTNAQDAPWVVVAMSTREDPDLFRKLVLAGVRDVPFEAARQPSFEPR
jgi:hypothetical protein